MRLFAALCAVMVLTVTSMESADAKKVFRLSIQLPMTSTLGKNIAAFKQQVEKATAGNIEIQIFDSGQLFDDKDVPRAVGAGQIDFGVASLARYGAAIPAVDLFHIPFLFDSDAKLRVAVKPGSPVRGPLDEAILKTGGRVLWWQAYGGTILLSKGGTLVKTPADIQGKKVRVFGKLLGTWVSANGGLPVNVAGGEQFVAYQRGTVDIGMTGPDTIKSRKMWEVMDGVTVANLANIEFVVVINDKIFQGLSDEERQIITDAAKAVEAKLRDDFSQIEKEALDAGRQNKMTIYMPNAVEMEAFRKSADVVRDEFLRSAGTLGRQVYDATLALR
jgi:C4-dicarboxylate-binding protein DctP